MALDTIPAYSAFHCGDLGLAYNEAAFRHFLGLEQRRASRSMRSLLLILVTRKHRARKEQMPSPLATQVFKVLGASLREVDFVGWYRENAVAAAVVTLGGEATPDVKRRIQARVMDGLAAGFVPSPNAQLRVRVVRLVGKVKH